MLATIHPTNKNLTENSSTNPQTRNAHANPTTESVNPALPSNVLCVVGDHRYRPTRLPTTDAYILVIRSSTAINPSLSSDSKLTTASPTPIVKIPVYISKREGLQHVSVRKVPHDWKHRLPQQEFALTLQTTMRLRTQSTGKSGLEWPSHYPSSPGIRS
jgi:hypothetical protein